MRLFLLFLAFVVQSSFARVCLAHFDYTYSNGQWIPLENTKITEQFNCGVRFLESSCAIKLGESKERMASETDGCVVQGDEVFCGCSTSDKCNADIVSFYEQAVKLKPNLAKCAFTFNNQPFYSSYYLSRTLNCIHFSGSNPLFVKDTHTWKPLSAGEHITGKQCVVYLDFLLDCKITSFIKHSSFDTGCENSENGVACQCSDHDMCSMDIDRWIAYAKNLVGEEKLMKCNWIGAPSYDGKYPVSVSHLPAVAPVNPMNPMNTEQPPVNSRNPTQPPVNPRNPEQPSYPNPAYRPQDGSRYYYRNHGSSWNRFLPLLSMIIFLV